METKKIKYKGRSYICRQIIDLTSIIELLEELAKKQDLLEQKIDFQNERINNKDERISELEVMVKGSSQSKEEKFVEKKPKEEKSSSKSSQKDDDKKTDENGKKISSTKKDKTNDDKKNKDEDDENKDEGNDEDNKDDNEDKEDKEEKNGGEKDEKGDEEKKDDENKDNEDNEDNKKDDENKDEKNGGEKDENDDNGEKSQKSENGGDDENEKIEEIKIDSQKTVEKNGAENLKNAEMNKTNKDDEEKYENDIDESNIDGNNNNQIKKILKRLKILEEKVENLEERGGSTVVEKQVVGSSGTSKKTSGGDNRFKILTKRIKELDDKDKQIEIELDALKGKVNDFNIYDLLKDEDTGNGNVDICKGLVMALENKIFKKLGFYDQKFKKNETDIFNCQNEIKNINANIDGLKNALNKINDQLNELRDNIKTKNSEIDKNIVELQRQLKELNERFDKETKSNKDEHSELDKAIKELEHKIEEQANNQNLGNIVNDMQGQLSQKDLELIQELNKRISDIEKTLKVTLGKFSPKDVLERIDNLETETAKKASKYDLSEINDRISYYDDITKDLNFKMDNINNFSEKQKADIQQITKKIEYLSGEVNKLSMDSFGKSKSDAPIIDLSKLVDFNVFNETKKEYNKKFDKVKLSFEEIARNLDEILEKLSHTPTDKDFAQFQSIIKNMIDELKLNLGKRFADKLDVNKSIKFLETQIKTIQESYSRKAEGADNWLLAKKPLNNYVCASCESIIRGELDKRSEFIPWNRYPNRDEKNYRMGHGFSRMLQMINEEKKKYQENKENVSDDDRRSNCQSKDSDSNNLFINASVKLPKLKHRVQSNNVRNNNINGLEDAPLDQGSSPYDDMDSIISSDRPKIMKIYKKTKNSPYKRHNSSKEPNSKSSDNLPNLVANTVPNEPKDEGKTEIITSPNDV